MSSRTKVAAACAEDEMPVEPVDATGDRANKQTMGKKKKAGSESCAALVLFLNGKFKYAPTDASYADRSELGGASLQAIIRKNTERMRDVVSVDPRFSIMINHMATHNRRRTKEEQSQPKRPSYVDQLFHKMDVVAKELGVSPYFLLQTHAFSTNQDGKTSFRKLYHALIGQSTDDKGPILTLLPKIKQTLKAIEEDRDILWAKGEDQIIFPKEGIDLTETESICGLIDGNGKRLTIHSIPETDIPPHHQMFTEDQCRFIFEQEINGTTRQLVCSGKLSKCRRCVSMEAGTMGPQHSTLPEFDENGMRIRALPGMYEKATQANHRRGYDGLYTSEGNALVVGLANQVDGIEAYRRDETLGPRKRGRPKKQAQDSNDAALERKSRTLCKRYHAAIRELAIGFMVVLFMIVPVLPTEIQSLLTDENKEFEIVQKWMRIVLGGPAKPVTRRGYFTLLYNLIKHYPPTGEYSASVCFKKLEGFFCNKEPGFLTWATEPPEGEETLFTRAQLATNDAVKTLESVKLSVGQFSGDKINSKKMRRVAVLLVSKVLLTIHNSQVREQRASEEKRTKARALITTGRQTDVGVAPGQTLLELLTANTELAEVACEEDEPINPNQGPSLSSVLRPAGSEAKPTTLDRFEGSLPTTNVQTQETTADDTPDRFEGSDPTTNGETQGTTAVDISPTQKPFPIHLDSFSYVPDVPIPLPSNDEIRNLYGKGQVPVLCVSPLSSLTCQQQLLDKKSVIVDSACFYYWCRNLRVRDHYSQFGIPNNIESPMAKIVIEQSQSYAEKGGEWGVVRHPHVLFQRYFKRLPNFPLIVKGVVAKGQRSSTRDSTLSGPFDGDSGGRRVSLGYQASNPGEGEVDGFKYNCPTLKVRETAQQVWGDDCERVLYQLGELLDAMHDLQAAMDQREGLEPYKPDVYEEKLFHVPFRSEFSCKRSTKTHVEIIVRFVELGEYVNHHEDKLNGLIDNVTGTFSCYGSTVDRVTNIAHYWVCRVVSNSRLATEQAKRSVGSFYPVVLENIAKQDAETAQDYRQILINRTDGGRAARKQQLLSESQRLSSLRPWTLWLDEYWPWEEFGPDKVGRLHKLLALEPCMDRGMTMAAYVAPLSRMLFAVDYNDWDDRKRALCWYLLACWQNTPPHFHVAAVDVLNAATADGKPTAVDVYKRVLLVWEKDDELTHNEGSGSTPEQTSSERSKSDPPSDPTDGDDCDLDDGDEYEPVSADSKKRKRTAAPYKRWSPCGVKVLERLDDTNTDAINSVCVILDELVEWCEDYGDTCSSARVRDILTRTNMRLKAVENAKVELAEFKLWMFIQIAANSGYMTRGFGIVEKMYCVEGRGSANHLAKGAATVGLPKPTPEEMDVTLDMMSRSKKYPYPNKALPESELCEGDSERSVKDVLMFGQDITIIHRFDWTTDGVITDPEATPTRGTRKWGTARWVEAAEWRSKASSDRKQSVRPTTDSSAAWKSFTSRDASGPSSDRDVIADVDEVCMSV